MRETEHALSLQGQHTHVVGAGDLVERFFGLCYWIPQDMHRCQLSKSSPEDMVCESNPRIRAGRAAHFMDQRACHVSKSSKQSRSES